MPINGAYIHTYTNSGYSHKYAVANGKKGAFYVNSNAKLGAPYPLVSGYEGTRIGEARNGDGTPLTGNVGTNGQVLPTSSPPALGILFSSTDTSGLASTELSVEAKSELMTVGATAVIDSWAIRSASNTDLQGQGGTYDYLTAIDYPQNETAFAVTGSDAAGAMNAHCETVIQDAPTYTTNLLKVSHDYAFQRDGTNKAQQQIKVTVTLQNLTGSALSGIHYLRCMAANPNPLVATNPTLQWGSIVDPTLFAVRSQVGSLEVSLGVDSTQVGAALWVQSAGSYNETTLSRQGWSSGSNFQYVLLGVSGAASIRTRSSATDSPQSGDTTGSTTSDYTAPAFQSAVHSALGIGTAQNSAMLLMSPALTVPTSGSVTFVYYVSFGSTPPPDVSPAPPVPDGVRLYNANGKRKGFPSNRLGSIDFTLSERGGCLEGNLGLDLGWDELTLDGTERVDIWQWGQLLYRGWVRLRQRDLSGSGRVSLTLYGLMDRLNGYLVRRCACYSGATNLATIFTDLVSEYVTRSGRLPNLVIDTTGVAALGLTATVFCAKGKTFPEALNQLCDIAPGRLIWGCDVDATGNDRLYLRPRATSPTQFYAIGKNVAGFVYPQDATEVVNTLYVTGGTADFPNLLKNGSFENCVKPGETTTNLLRNPGFDANNGSNSADYWDRTNDPTIDVNGRNSPGSFDMDNNPNSNEAISQTVDIGSVSGLTGSFWYKVFVGGVNKFKFKLELLNASSTVLYSSESAEQTAIADGLFHQFVYPYPSWPADPLIAKCRLTLTLTYCLDDSKGLKVDDFALYPPDPAVESWKVGQANNGSFSLLQWQCRDASPSPAHGGNKVKAAAILASGGYVELATADADRVSVKHAYPYTVRFLVQAVTSSGKVRVGARLYKSDGTLQRTAESGDITIVAGGIWQEAAYSFTTELDTDKVEVFVRLYENGRTFYLDAAGLWEGTTAPNGYYVGTNFEGVKRTSDYTSFDIGAEAAASITTYGEREAEVSVDAVRDYGALGVYAQDYFKAHAVPKVQGRLTISDAQKPLTFDGQVKLVNLPNAPAPLNVAKAKYTIRAAVSIDADLNNERPDLAALLVGQGATS